MPRRRAVPKREILPDPKFHDKTIAKFINVMMVDGKKAVSERIMYGALELVENKKSGQAVEVFRKALENVSPSVEVKSRRVGGSTYQVPVEVRPKRQIALAMRWLITYARKRGEKSMTERLAGELLDAFQEKGSTVKKREETHKMAESNKAFSHFRF